MVKIGPFASAVALTLGVSAEVRASPPPPPATYVEDAAKLLTQANGEHAGQLANFVADDVKEYVNDRLVADGKARWLAVRRTEPSGTIIGYSDGWDGSSGRLMIVDQFDTVDRSKLPPSFAADPRYATRATVYEFGPDEKIHLIRTLTSKGFWIKP